MTKPNEVTDEEIDALVVIHPYLSAVIEKLIAHYQASQPEKELVMNLLAEMNTYLDHGNGTSIGSGSIFHHEIKALLQALLSKVDNND